MTGLLLLTDRRANTVCLLYHSIIHSLLNTHTHMRGNDLSLVEISIVDTSRVKASATLINFVLLGPDASQCAIQPLPENPN